VPPGAAAGERRGASRPGRGANGPPAHCGPGARAVCSVAPPRPSPRDHGHPASARPARRRLRRRPGPGPRRRPPARRAPVARRSGGVGGARARVDRAGAARAAHGRRGRAVAARARRPRGRVAHVRPLHRPVLRPRPALAPGRLARYPPGGATRRRRGAGARGGHGRQVRPLHPAAARHRSSVPRDHGLARLARPRGNRRGRQLRRHARPRLGGRVRAARPRPRGPRRAAAGGGGGGAAGGAGGAARAALPVQRPQHRVGAHAPRRRPGRRRAGPARRRAPPLARRARASPARCATRCRSPTSWPRWTTTSP
jgi:hypothetical protein